MAKNFKRTLKKETESKIQMVRGDQSDTGRDEAFVIFEGKRIAKRGYPDTAQAGTWVSLEPGFKVYDTEDTIVIERNGVGVH